MPKFKRQELSEDDVLSIGDTTFKAGKFKQAVESCFDDAMGYGLSSALSNKEIKISPKKLAGTGGGEAYARWFGDGIECEVLKVGAQGWQKAKVRVSVSVEFYTEASDTTPQSATPQAAKVPPPPVAKMPPQPPKPQPQPQPQPAAKVAPPAPPASNGSYIVPDELLEDIWG